jgi:hypothetical protein
MADNCTNPNAVNYNPNATFDDGSCIYMNKVGGICYAFQDVAPGALIDKSFTLSWDVIGGNWVFFHDYIPDFYFSTREKLYMLKAGVIFQAHAGVPGAYFESAPKSFFIDVVFNGQQEMTLNAINWITEVLNQDGSTATFDTLTHITVWNSYQCSGRIPLSQIYSDLEYEVRKTAGRWSYDDFRNAIVKDGVPFLQDLFHNFAVIPGAVSPDIPWYEQQELEDNYFIVRFEFDNSSGKKIYLNDTMIDFNTSYR